MFGVINAAMRAFVVGVVVGMLFAPRPGLETRRMLNERIGAMINQLLEIAARQQDQIGDIFRARCGWYRRHERPPLKTKERRDVSAAASRGRRGRPLANRRH